MRQPSLSAAISEAALCRRPIDGKRHSHQTRIPVALLAEANRRLQRDRARVKSCRSFDDLLQLVADRIGSLDRVGALTVSDIALRIGTFLGRKPKKVYLHRGTADGARALGFRGRKTVEVRELPRELRRLAAAEIEDCLCSYKREIARICSS